MKYLRIIPILAIIYGLVLLFGCLSAGDFDIRINSAKPLVRSGVEFVAFEFVIKPLNNSVQPNTRYFIELYSSDGHFFDNNSVVWSKQDLTSPEEISRDERNVEKIKAYKLAVANYPPRRLLKNPSFEQIRGENRRKDGW